MARFHCLSFLCLWLINTYKFALAQQAVQICSGRNHNCVLFDNKKIKCFGANNLGQLGLGDTRPRGITITELGDNLPFVDLGANFEVDYVGCGSEYTCALSTNGLIKCFGNNEFGQLGLGFTGLDGVGSSANQMGDNLATVDLGSLTFESITVRFDHACAVTAAKEVKCWGVFVGPSNECGLNGNNILSFGDDSADMGDDLPFVDFGSPIRDVTVGGSVTCAVYESTLEVNCRGSNLSGQLAKGNTNCTNILDFDNVTIDLGTGALVSSVMNGNGYSCAILDSGDMKCWGRDSGFAYEDSEERGDEPGEMGNALLAVQLGNNLTPLQVDGFDNHNCVVFQDGSLKCFGFNLKGQLGQGDTTARGLSSNTMGNFLPFVQLGTGANVTQVSVGLEHTCVLLSTSEVKCFGRNDFGQLGLGTTEDIGDESGEMGDNLRSVMLTGNVDTDDDSLLPIIIGSAAGGLVLLLVALVLFLRNGKNESKEFIVHNPPRRPGGPEAIRPEGPVPDPGINQS